MNRPRLTRGQWSLLRWFVFYTRRCIQNNEPIQPRQCDGLSVLKLERAGYVARQGAGFVITPPGAQRENRRWNCGWRRL